MDKVGKDMLRFDRSILVEWFLTKVTIDDTLA